MDARFQRRVQRYGWDLAASDDVGAAVLTVTAFEPLGG